MVILQPQKWRSGLENLDLIIWHSCMLLWLLTRAHNIDTQNHDQVFIWLCTGYLAIYLNDEREQSKSATKK